MSKYIDTEKLIAEIERYKQGAAIARFDNAGENADYFQGKVDLCDDLTHIITSLQQEQPEGLHFTPLNRLIQKIPSEKWNDSTNNYAKKLRDCLIKEGYLKDAKVLQDYISYMNGNNVPMATMDEQEQPEVSVECYVRVYPTLDNKPRKWVSLCKHGICCNSIRDIPELETLGFKDDDTAIVTISRKEE